MKMDEIATPMDIIFSDITYIPNTTKKNGKKILTSVSGNFRAGELNAIMGPSGAGKSSLMNILSGFTKQGVKGNVKFGNMVKNRKICCHILQEDNFFPWFTLGEVMMFTATLKISNKSMMFKDKQMLVENILDVLHLSSSKNTKCNSLSGGQKKRLSIALELIDNPPIIFLDEPTTGLDSSSTMDLVKLLNQLCLGGRTIICTIHQPSASIYMMFGLIYVLDKGICVYQGTPGNTVNFLRVIGLECPSYHNPADYLLEVITGAYGNHTEAMILNASNNNWCSTIKEKEIIKLDRKASIKKNKSSWLSLTSANHIYPPPEWIKLWILIGRCHIQFYRDWTVTHLKLGIHIICAVLVGLLFGDSGINATKSISNVGLFLVTVVYLWYTTMMPGILKFPNEILIVKRETFNNWYKIRTYYLATLITSTPVHIIFATIFSTIIYFLTNQPYELDRYIKFCLIHIALTIAADGFGMLLGSLLNPVNGTFVGSVLTCFMLIFSGFLIMFEHMSIVMRGISYSSPQRFALESLVLSVYNNNRTDMICPHDEMYCHFKSPSIILKNLGMTNGDYNFNFLMLLIQTSFFKVLAFITLKRSLQSQ